ncbi:hypothetical protein MKZ38_006866 [Zalerion maritima]|uniref:Uncharacterized protein n=1 Tax=Zalerion maritima TaxID=339359 RepID=A0AAD5RIR0_9PEZI|nr:hypothetical protein MKZ38_006866 [Zalerion maritima]
MQPNCLSPSFSSSSSCKIGCVKSRQDQHHFFSAQRKESPNISPNTQRATVASPQPQAAGEGGRGQDQSATIEKLQARVTGLEDKANDCLDTISAPRAESRTLHRRVNTLSDKDKQQKAQTRTLEARNNNIYNANRELLRADDLLRGVEESLKEENAALRIAGTNSAQGLRPPTRQSMANYQTQSEAEKVQLRQENLALRQNLAIA